MEQGIHFDFFLGFEVTSFFSLSFILLFCSIKNKFKEEKESFIADLNYVTEKKKGRSSKVSYHL